MSRWRWQATRGTMPDGNHERFPIRDTIDEAYDEAERAYDQWPTSVGRRYVAILLHSPRGTGVADTKDADSYDGEWVVGREQWRQSELDA